MYKIIAKPASDASLYHHIDAWVLLRRIYYNPGMDK